MSDLPKAIVYTWGTKVGGSNYGHNIKVKKSGGNVGHASIELRLPVNKESEELIKKYCDANKIPYEKVQVKVPYIIFEKDDKDGKFTGKISEKMAHESEYYKIYFSVWPDFDGISLQKNLQDDQKMEREGVNFSWKDELLKDKELEIDKRGKKRLGPEVRVHSLPANQQDRNELVNYAQMTNELRKKSNELWKLHGKMKGMKKNDPKYAKLDEARDSLHKEINKLRTNIKASEKTLRSKNLFDKYIVLGNLPDNTVELPLKSNVKPGLDAEKMLQGMVKIANEKKDFDLYHNNCSAAVGVVIADGIPPQEKTLKKTFKTTGGLGIATPQVVLNNAQKMKNHFSLNKQAKANLIFSKPTEDKKEDKKEKEKIEIKPNLDTKKPK